MAHLPRLLSTGGRSISFGAGGILRPWARPEMGSEVSSGPPRFHEICGNDKLDFMWVGNSTAGGTKIISIEASNLCRRNTGNQNAAE